MTVSSSSNTKNIKVVLILFPTNIVPFRLPEMRGVHEITSVSRGNGRHTTYRRKAIHRDRLYADLLAQHESGLGFGERFKLSSDNIDD
jgi:hypothetical protein